MNENELLLQKSQDELSDILKPYQQKINRQQKAADLLKLCIRSASKEDFFRLDELLKSKLAQSIQEEPELHECLPVFKDLLEYADQKVDEYRVKFIDDLKTLAEEAQLPIEIDFPRFSILKGIEGVVDFPERITMINKKKINSVDPKKIVSAALKYKKQLYDRSFDPQTFIDSLFDVYSSILKKEGQSVGTPISIRQFYLEYVMSLQSKLFFQDMDKGKFKGYSLEQFAIDLWCYFEANTSGTSKGYAISLKSGRNNSLWLIDSDGEKRQITSISFQVSN